jgi:hypothetical protein
VGVADGFHGVARWTGDDTVLDCHWAKKQAYAVSVSTQD